MKQWKADCVLRLTFGEHVQEYPGVVHVVEQEYDARWKVAYGHMTGTEHSIDELADCDEAQMTLEDGRTALIRPTRTFFHWSSEDCASYSGFYFVAFGTFDYPMGLKPAHVPTHSPKGPGAG